MDSKTGREIARAEYNTKDENPKFEYAGETFEVNNFMFTPLPEIIKRVNEAVENNDRWAVRESEALATFMKESDKIGIIMNVNPFDLVIPGFGFGIKSRSSNRIQTIMVPFECMYTKDEWSYKIELHALDENIRAAVGTERFYFCDLLSGIMSGHYKLVDITDPKTIDMLEPAPEIKVKVYDFC